MAAAKAEKTIKMRVLRDYWDEEGERVRKNTEVDVPPEAAIDGTASGALARVKD